MHRTSGAGPKDGTEHSGIAGEDLWTKCPACDAFLYRKQLQDRWNVCPKCGHHLRLPVRRRLAQLLDRDSFVELSRHIEPQDPLGFVDSKPYSLRLREAQGRTGTPDGMLFGTGAIGGMPVVVAASDFEFMGGSMGSAVGEAFVRAAELAIRTRTPLLTIASSGGARVQEGCLSLMQLAKTSQAVARLRDEGILFISLLTDPTYGGTTASFATLGDLLIAESHSRIGFAGPHVIKQTIGQRLPDGFQTAEYLMERGMLDLVVRRGDLRPLLSRVLSFHENCARPDHLHLVSDDEPLQLSESEGQCAITDPGELSERDAWEVVRLARHVDRPTVLEYINLIFDDFQELHGDRMCGDDPALIGGLAKLDSVTVVVVGHQKGHSIAQMVERNFGMAHPEGYRKATRLMQYAAKFGMPIVTLIDTPGAYPGIEAEERGQAMAIASCIMHMSQLPVPIVAVVTGEGASGGAMALAVGDRVLMMENAWYGVISPEGCSTIVYKSGAHAPRAAASLRLTARDLLILGIIDTVVPEPAGGAHHDVAATAANLKKAVVTNLNDLLKIPRRTLLDERYERFRAFGAVQGAGKVPGEDDEGLHGTCGSVTALPKPSLLPFSHMDEHAERV